MRACVLARPLAALRCVRWGIFGSCAHCWLVEEKACLSAVGWPQADMRLACAWQHLCSYARKRLILWANRWNGAQEKEDWINAVGRAIVRHSKRRASPHQP